MYFLKPLNLEIENLIEKNKHIYIGSNLNIDKLLYICHSLINSRSNNRKKMNYLNTTFAPLNAQMLKEVVSNQHDAVKFLIKVGVIQTDGHYKVGDKSRGYRFSKLYDGQPIVKVEVKNYIIKKAIRRFSIKKGRECSSKMRGYKFLTKWWDADRLKIDKVGAYEWIENYQNIKLNQVENEFSQRQIVNTCEDFKILVSKFDNGDFGNIHFDDSGHRLYTPLTGMKRELRGFVKFDNQNLVNLDLKNSQPYLSLKLFDKSFWTGKIASNSFKLRDLDYNLYRNIRKDKEIYNNIIMLLDSLEKQYGKEFQDFNSYQNMVLTGSLYEYLLSQMQPRFPLRFFNRNSTKKETLRILYSNPVYENLLFYKPSKVFENLFPLEYGLFREIKLIKYNYLPILLQRIESFLIIDCICKNLSRINPEIPLFTIHDSIATIEMYKDIVSNEMNNVLEKYIGFAPKIEKEYLNKLVST